MRAQTLHRAAADGELTAGAAPMLLRREDPAKKAPGIMLSIGLVVALLAGADALSSLQQLSVRTVHARLPVATMLLGSGGDVPSVPFADNYKPAEIAALWKALKQCYGDEEAARRAVEQNNQVLCPVYATPQLLTQTNAALVKLVGKEEVSLPASFAAPVCRSVCLALFI